MFIQHRLISRSSRSLAVMIGSGASAKGRGDRHLRGEPDDAVAPRPKVTIPRPRLLFRPLL